MLFKYEGFNASGKRVSGTVEAPTQEMAGDFLRGERGIFLQDIAPSPAQTPMPIQTPTPPQPVQAAKTPPPPNAGRLDIEGLVERTEGNLEDEVGSSKLLVPAVQTQAATAPAETLGHPVDPAFYAALSIRAAKDSESPSASKLQRLALAQIAISAAFLGQ